MKIYSDFITNQNKAIEHSIAASGPIVERNSIHTIKVKGEAHAQGAISASKAEEVARSNLKKNPHSPDLKAKIKHFAHKGNRHRQAVEVAQRMVGEDTISEGVMKGNYHSVFSKDKTPGSKWGHHFDADSADDARAEVDMLKSSGQKTHVIRVPKNSTEARNWTKLGREGIHNYVVNNRISKKLKE